MFSWTVAVLLVPRVCGELLIPPGREGFSTCSLPPAPSHVTLWHQQRSEVRGEQRVLTVTAPMGGVIPGPNQGRFEQKTPLGVPLPSLVFPGSVQPSAFRCCCSSDITRRGFHGLMCPDLAGNRGRDNAQL